MSETPTDSPVPSEGPTRKLPQRGIRRRVLGEGEGDYCIYEIAPQESKLPKGALLPIPGVPRFEDTNAAMKWLRQESGDTLAGKQVMIFRATEILSLAVQQKAQVVISAKPKITVNDPRQGAETSS